METFTKLKAMVKNPQFESQRQLALSDLSDDMIDRPIIDIVNGFNQLPYCFTLQSCFGHFVHKGQKNAHNLEPLPAEGVIGKVHYKIAYMALCIEYNRLGKELFESLKEIPSIALHCVQFGCAEWFWSRHVNSYVLQVEPDRFKLQDTARLDLDEALDIEKTRDQFFGQLSEMIETVA